MSPVMSARWLTPRQWGRLVDLSIRPAYDRGPDTPRPTRQPRKPSQAPLGHQRHGPARPAVVPDAKRCHRPVAHLPGWHRRQPPQPRRPDRRAPLKGDGIAALDALCRPRTTAGLATPASVTSTAPTWPSSEPPWLVSTPPKGFATPT